MRTVSHPGAIENIGSSPEGGEREGMNADAVTRVR